MAEVASALGKVGLSTGITGGDLPWFGKLGLIVVMWLGRLESVPVRGVIAALMLRLHPRPRLTGSGSRPVPAIPVEILELFHFND